MIHFCINEHLEVALAGRSFLPAYEGESAGFDLYNASDKDFVVAPVYQNTKDSFKCLMPTGLRIAMYSDKTSSLVALVKERSSVTKTPLLLRAGVIDPGYTDQIFVACLNLSPEPYVIPAYAKSPFQLLIIRNENKMSQVSPDDWDYFVKDAKRGDGKIGSSDQS